MSESFTKHLAFEHLPEALQATIRPFYSTAVWVEQNIPDGPHRLVCLKKLLEAEDYAVLCAALKQEQKR